MSAPSQPSQNVTSFTRQASRASPITLQILSDLHLETPQFLPMYSEFSIRPRSIYLALLGDIGIASDERLFEFLTRQLQQFEVVFYVLGNHEPYGSTYKDAVDKMLAFESRIASQRVGEEGTSLGEFVFLNRRRYDLSPQVAILGCTLFSWVSNDQRSTVSTFVSDFCNITDWTVAQQNEAHRGDLAWLDEQVENISRTEPRRKLVVLTHYSPTMAAEANDPEHLRDPRGVQSAFVTDLRGSSCWSSPSVKIWAFGHTHWNCDFVDAETGKRLIANQRGYGREDIFNFDGDKVIRIE